MAASFSKSWELSCQAPSCRAGERAVPALAGTLELLQLDPALAVWGSGSAFTAPGAGLKLASVPLSSWR